MSEHASEQQPTFFRRHRWLVWLAGVALVVVVALAVAAAIIARRIEPFLRAEIVTTLSDRLHALEGLLTIESQAGRGTRLRAEIPSAALTVAP